MYRASYVEEAWGDWTLILVILNNKSGISKMLEKKTGMMLLGREVQFVVSKNCNFPSKIEDMKEYKNLIQGEEDA